MGPKDISKAETLARSNSQTEETGTSLVEKICPGATPHQSFNPILKDWMLIGVYGNSLAILLPFSNQERDLNLPEIAAQDLVRYNVARMTLVHTDKGPWRVDATSEGKTDGKPA